MPPGVHRFPFRALGSQRPTITQACIVLKAVDNHHTKRTRVMSNESFLFTRQHLRTFTVNLFFVFSFRFSLGSVFLFSSIFFIFLFLHQFFSEP